MAGSEPEPSGARLVEFVAVMEQLRRECSWKREQTHRSLARYLLEETYEVLEAIDTGDLAHLREELGDLLLQVYFHAIIAAESGAFTIDDVAGDIVEKMRRRNPHVFGPEAGTALDAASVDELWESVKAQEKPRTSPVEGIPATLPALLYATKVLDRLSREKAVVAPRVGSSGGASGQSGSEELGERLLALVAEARAGGIDAEQALRDAVRRRL